MATLSSTDPFDSASDVLVHSGPGQRLFGEDLAPFYALEVESEWLFTDVTRFIKQVEWEETVDMCSRLKITVFNPRHAFDVVGEGTDEESELPDFTSHKVFLPGNEVNVYGGYGPYSRAEFMGRVKLWKHMPRFPRDEQPVLEINGYDASKYMMGERSGIQVTGGRTTTTSSGDNEGNVYVSMTHSEIVRNIADKYGFLADIDDTDRPLDTLQKRDMSDYALVKNLANANNREFWVDYDNVRRAWVLHWRNPADDNRAKYTFRYNAGSESTLLEFEPEYTLDDGLVELKVMFFNRATGQWDYLTESGADMEEEDPRFRRGASRGSRSTVSRRPDGTRRAGGVGESIEEQITSASALRLAAAGHSIDVVADRPFASAADAVEFARRWFAKRKNSFILGTGKIVGCEKVRPRQVHNLQGLGPRLSGDWYFVLVRHEWVPDQGYSTVFKAHKVIDR